MMKRHLFICLFLCASNILLAQSITNYVRNGDMESYSQCPEAFSQINYALFWSCPIDSSFSESTDYLNVCGNSFPDASLHVPNNVFFNQSPHSGNGLAAANFYFDKTLPLPPILNYRDYLQGRLYKLLSAGKAYCVSFWVNMTEASAYGHNKIGAYLDNGAINSLPVAPGSEITSVVPHVYTNTRIIDTANWVKIEGSFVASGKETYITIGVFADISLVDTVTTNYWHGSTQYSYYLVDDIAVVPIDAVAQAGVDRWVEMGKQTQIGPVEDSTARGMDCQWYYQGKWIGNGNVITVSASTFKNAVDTYVVVQNVCGKTTRDTMLLRTVGAGMGNVAPTENTFSIIPNPSNGNLIIARNSLSSFSGKGNQSEPIFIKVYDLLGRVVFEQSFILNKAQTPLALNLAKGTYILELRTEDAVQRERIVIE